MVHNSYDSALNGQSSHLYYENIHNVDIKYLSNQSSYYITSGKKHAYGSHMTLFTPRTNITFVLDKQDISPFSFPLFFPPFTTRIDQPIISQVLLIDFCTI
jgi:hypothetical protein